MNKLETDVEMLLGTAFDHDLKNLLNTRNGYEELLEEASDEEEIEMYRQRMKNAEESIEQLYNRFEDAGESEKLSFHKIVGDSIEMMHQKIQRRGKNVSVDWDSAPDEEYDLLVERMLYNLFDNSLDHGNGDIHIEVTEASDYIEVGVEDGGELSDEEWNNVFPEADDRSSYMSTGSYVIDRIAEKKDIEIEPGLETDYTVKIPK